jgi:hypothetical protein
MDSSMASACKGKPAAAAVPGHHLSERFLTPRWGVSRFGLGTQGGARDAGLPWAGMLRTVGAAPSGPENVQTPVPKPRRAAFLRSVFLPQRPALSLSKGYRGRQEIQRR